MAREVRRGCIAAAFAGLLVLAACGGGSSNNATTPPNNNAAGNNAAQNPVQPQQTKLTLKLVKIEACHTEKKAGGNSDGLAEYEVTTPDGTVVHVKFTADDGTNVEGEAKVKGNKFIVRFKLVRIGEKLTLKEVKVGDVTLTDADFTLDPFTVPSTSDCDLSADEATFNAN
jgi:hypothetical protein